MLALVLALAAYGADVRLAVAEFDNAADSAQFDALGKGLQAMVTTDLAQVEGITLVERDRLSEVVAELELGDSGLVDPSTAAKLGKLLGASHVVMGTFTVVDQAMRLDARLVDVGTGTVVTAADASGEKDAFFELEKDLVKTLAAAIDAELTPKERAALARIHTADFEAFEGFSESVALYDAARYDDAVATLEKVLVRDEEFKLAKRTLEEYEALIEEIRAKSRAIAVTEAELKFATSREQARAEAEVVGWLQGVADDPARSQEDRITALYLLARGLPPFRFSSSTRFGELQDVEDRFALYRASEVAYARIYAELRPRWPERGVFLTASEGPDFDGTRTRDEQLARHRGKLFDETYKRYNLLACTGQQGILGDAGDLLLLDARERVVELDRLTEEGRACIGEDQYVRDRIELAEAYTGILDLEHATAVLEKLASESTDTQTLDRVGHVLGEIKKVATLIEEDRPKAAPTWWETMLLAQKGTSSYKHDTWRKQVHDGDVRGLWELARLRQLGTSVHEEYVWVGDQLVWVLFVRGSTELQSGPRTDRRRTASLRYYGNAEPQTVTSFVIGGGTVERVEEAPPPRPAWMVLGEGTRSDLTVSVDLNYTAADDWWPTQRPPPREATEASRPLSPGRPRVGVLLGVRDVETPAICDPTGKGMTTVPMTAWGVLLDADTVRIGKVREVDPDLSDKSCSSFTDDADEWAFEEVSSASVGTGGASRKLSVAVAGTTVTVKVDKTTKRFTLPEVPSGFPGLVAHGVGYVELSSIRLE